MPDKPLVMQRRHFEFIADAISDYLHSEKDISVAFAERLAVTNSKFDKAKFFKRCNENVNKLTGK